MNRSPRISSSLHRSQNEVPIASSVHDLCFFRKCHDMKRKTTCDSISGPETSRDFQSRLIYAHMQLTNPESMVFFPNHPKR